MLPSLISDSAVLVSGWLHPAERLSAQVQLWRREAELNGKIVESDHASERRLLLKPLLKKQL
jgi:hypothetical protein